MTVRRTGQKIAVTAPLPLFTIYIKSNLGPRKFAQTIF